MGARVGFHELRIKEEAAVLESVPSPGVGQAGWTLSELRRVVIRLVDGDTVQVATAPDRERALALAREVVQEIERPEGEWPLIGDRLIRPGAIVSVDVLRRG